MSVRVDRGSEEGGCDVLLVPRPDAGMLVKSSMGVIILKVAWCETFCLPLWRSSIS